MPSRGKKEEQKTEDPMTSTGMATLAAMLTEHKVSLLAEFNAAFTKLETKLDNIQTTILDHQHRLSSLEPFADTTSQDIRAIATMLTTVTEENGKLKSKLIGLEGRSRRNNIRIVGLPEYIEPPQTTAFFFQLLLETLGEHTLESAPELDRAHRTLTAKPSPGEKPRAVVICFHRYQTRELVVREARRQRGKLKYKDIPIHIFEDYCPEIVEQRSAYRDDMKELYNLSLKPSLHYPAKLFIMAGEGKRRRLTSPEDAQNFISSYRHRRPGPTDD
ncbi:uncharacterized protein LOC129695034 [Leucoraja erinacea]|uniref:uncharacterized protein LOC129695034 n=1 Tax=Leucoraja erinaceus TaxID=7782 RepID=UPI002458CA9A|nr:uncharacterized protein LOC129695034 [Leucoraja erinacea]